MPQAALPDHKDPPAVAAQLASRHLVAGNVVGELGRPERDIALRRIGERATTMSMPETTVHKNNDAVPFQDYVRSTRKTPVVKPESVAQLMQDRSDGNLRLCVARFDPGHVPTAMR